MLLSRVSFVISLCTALMTGLGCAPADLDVSEEEGAQTSELRVPPKKPAPVKPAPDAGKGRLCGTRGAGECAANEFCNREPDAQCGATDRGGACEARPEVCPAIFNPVCGCDNRTYASACNAHGNGVSVKREGACGEPECRALGGKVLRSNGANVPVCDKGVDGFSITGLEPTVCCLPKPPEKRICGTVAGLRCGEGQFCNYERAAGGQGCGGMTDASGVCEAQPRICTREYAPVCGCDRRTYATACTAHAAGVSVMRSDACTEIDCAAVGGTVVNGIGPAPVCPAGQIDRGPVRYTSGQVAIEGAICCVPR